MSINVYWTSCEDEWLLQKKPDSVIARFNNRNLKTNDKEIMEINSCPAILNEFQNTFNIYSLYDYDFSIEENRIISQGYDQNFFQNHIIIRSLQNKLFSFNQRFIFFTEEDSLEATIFMPPNMEDNNITKRCLLLSGRIDIGKWFRSTDFAFFLRDDHTSFKIEREEVMCYVKFHTKEKINLKQFIYTNTLRQYANACGCISKSTRKSPLIKLENYYKLLKHKKMILKEIKNNLVN